MAKANRGFDAGRQHLGYVYAQALLSAAEKVDSTEAVLSELDALIDEVLEKLPKLRDALSAPKVSLEDKLGLIDKALGGKVSPVLINTLKVMARHERLDCIGDVRDAYHKLYNELRGTVEVHVRVAAKIDPAMLAKIKERLQAMLHKNVDIQVEIHPEMLGGVVVKVGDTLFDGSLLAKLEQLRANALVTAERELRQSLDRFVAL